MRFVTTIIAVLLKVEVCTQDQQSTKWRDQPRTPPSAIAIMGSIDLEHRISFRCSLALPRAIQISFPRFGPQSSRSICRCCSPEPCLPKPSIPGPAWAGCSHGRFHLLKSYHQHVDSNAGHSIYIASFFTQQKPRISSDPFYNCYCRL